MSKKVGRPRIEIDLEKVRRMCETHCTKDEICYVFGIDEKTLSARLKEVGYDKGFSDYYSKFESVGKVSLRAKQWEVAMEGDGKMLNWLGKQYLGQRDKQEMDMTTRQAQPLKIEFVGEDTAESSD